MSIEYFRLPEEELLYWSKELVEVEGEIYHLILTDKRVLCYYRDGWVDRLISVFRKDAKMMFFEEDRGLQQNYAWINIVTIGRVLRIGGEREMIEKVNDDIELLLKGRGELVDSYIKKEK